MRKLALLILLVVSSSSIYALTPINGWCQLGGQRVSIVGSQSDSKVQASYPGCTIDVYVTGTLIHIPIYQNSTGTLLANPFQGDIINGFWNFYAAPGQTVDIRLSGSGIIPYSFPVQIPSNSGPGGQPIRAIGVLIDGVGAPIVDGEIRYYTVPFACTINGWNATSDTTDEVDFDVWKVATGTAIPTISNTILSSPLIKPDAQTAIHSTGLGSFTALSVAENDVFGFSVSSTTTATHVSVVLACQ